MKNLFIVLLLIAASGCGKANRPADADGTDLLESQREAMEKAKALEEDMQKALDERMKDVDGN